MIFPIFGESGGKAPASARLGVPEGAKRFSLAWALRGRGPFTFIAAYSFLSFQVTRTRFGVLSGARTDGSALWVFGSRRPSTRSADASARVGKRTVGDLKMLPHVVPLGQACRNALLGARATHAGLGHGLGSSTQKTEEAGAEN